MAEFELECRELTKRFGHFLAVDHVSLGIRKGEVFGFLGPNGCGKSTTIRMICGLLTPTSGKAYVSGLDVDLDPEGVKQRIGYMSQKFSLYDDLTVTENLEFFGGIYGLRNKKRRDRIAEVARLAGLEDETRSLVAELSTGVRQRLALAASILHSPGILILDEPTSGVDPTSRRRFWDLINDVASQGATILVTTHAMDEAEHCHRIAMMQSGRLVCVGEPEELMESRIQGDIYAIECEPLFPALAVAQSLPGVTDASVLASRLHVRSIDGNLNAETLANALRGAGIAVEAVAPGEPSLEDVFVAMAKEANE
ncbi:MAG TPA: ABC transporter ATP-binding protein [Fimbriimonadaceae bacterium]|nr:ABC transporter ATP-binding protein [Fimbriimonadaceae bacterium]